MHLDESSRDSTTTVFDTRKLAAENNSIIRSTSVSSATINQDTTQPPAKKMRSLMESLFDDASDDEDKVDMENFENNNPLKSLEINKNTSTIYVEETDSEGDDDD